MLKKNIHLFFQSPPKQEKDRNIYQKPLALGQNRQRNKGKVLLYSLLMLVVFWSCRTDHEPPPSEKAHTVHPWKLICIGNETTAGVGLADSLAYPAILENRLMEKPAVKVVNAGIKGETIAGVNQRIEWMLQQRFNAILLAMGEQDGMPERMKNWDDCLQKIRISNPKALILVGIVSKNNSFPPVKAFFKPFVDKYDVEVLDLQLVENNFWQKDVPYLSIKGQQELANRIYPAVE